MLSDFSLEELLRELKLKHVARGYKELAQRAVDESWSHLEFLAMVARWEINHREEARFAKLLRNARFPFLRTLDEFDWTHQSDRRLASIGSYLQADSITEGRCLILAGKPGSGKTHLAIAIAHRAIQQGFQALFTSAGALVEDLRAAEAKGKLAARRSTYTAPEVLVIDEMACLSYGPGAAQLLFDVIHQRHLIMRPVIVTTNKELPAWGPILGDGRLAAGIIDRLLERGRLMHLDGPFARGQRRIDSGGIPLGLDPGGEHGQQAYASYVVAHPVTPIEAEREHADSVLVEPDQVVSEQSLELAPRRMRQTRVDSQPEEHTRDIGQEIDRYVITRLLGTGGIGLVYVGLDTRTRGEVAIKVLQRAMTGNQDLHRRFLLEAQIPRLVKHRNIIQIMGCGTFGDGRPYYVMELLDGQSLRDRLQVNTPITVFDALRIFIDAADALRAIHRRGIVHRDLKPENLFLTFYASGQVVTKLVDFGIAKVPLKLAGIEFESRPLFTLGTPRYMAPERMVGAEGDPRTNLYALGLVMYETFTGGDWPWEVEMDDVMGQRTAHLDHRPRPSARLSKIGARLSRLVMRCLEKSPDARPQSADEVKAELMRVSTELPKKYLYSSHDTNVLSKLRRLIPRA